MSFDKNQSEGAYSSLKGWRRAVPIVLAALAVFIAICFITQETGALGQAISNVMLGLFAGGAYIIPAILFAHAYFYSYDVWESRIVSRIVFSFIAVISLSAIIHSFTYFGDELAFTPGKFYTDGKSAQGGGFIGGITAFAIIALVDYVGLIIIALLVLALYISFFFSKGRGAAKKSVFGLFVAIASVCALIEKGILTVVDYFKQKKKDKLERLGVAKTEELFDDDFFAVDNGLAELSIPALGIHEARSLKSLEENPTLQEKVHHKSASDEPPTSRVFYDDYGLGMNSSTQKSTAQTDDTVFVYDTPYNDTEKTAGGSDSKTRIEYGLDCNAGDVFTKDFNPIDFVSGEKEANRPSSRAAADTVNISREKTPEVTETVRAFSERDVEMARRKADFDMKKKAALDAMRREREMNGSTAAQSTYARTESAAATENIGVRAENAYSQERYKRAAQFISGINAEYTKSVPDEVRVREHESTANDTGAHESFVKQADTVFKESFVNTAKAPEVITFDTDEADTADATNTDTCYNGADFIDVSRSMMNATPDVLCTKSDEDEGSTDGTDSVYIFNKDDSYSEADSDDKSDGAGIELLTDTDVEDGENVGSYKESTYSAASNANLYTYSDTLGEDEGEDDKPPFEVDEKTTDSTKKKNDYSSYTPPSLDLLAHGVPQNEAGTDEELEENGNKIIETLASFGVLAAIKGYEKGPRITRYEVVPSTGVRVQQVVNLFDDIALNLATEGIRIEAPIPGKAAIGFELPNKKPETVRLRDLLECDEFVNSPSKTLACIGKDVGGSPVFGDIAKMPHVLIAGATGMGKSVCINSILISILYKARPDEVKLILIDPKKVEFKMYNGIPHLLVPVVADPKQAAGALMWACEEMERRYELLENLNVRNIEGYNEKVSSNKKLGDPLPKLIIVIDELNDLMLQVRDPVEKLIMSIAQKARAAGIHLIIGTQRPSVNVITGVIKANIPSRMSCKVASYTDSKTILECAGAERLLDKGDMLYYPVGTPKPKRVQSAFVSDSEVYAVMDALKANSTGAEYDNTVMEDINRAAQKCVKSKGGSSEDRGSRDDGGTDGVGFLNDKQFLDAVELAVNSGKISTSQIQRRVGVGYGKAAKFIDIMEDMGIVGPPNGQKPRDALISFDEWLEKRSRLEID